MNSSTAHSRSPGAPQDLSTLTATPLLTQQPKQASILPPKPQESFCHQQRSQDDTNTAVRRKENENYKSFKPSTPNETQSFWKPLVEYMVVLQRWFLSAEGQNTSWYLCLVWTVRKHQQLPPWSHRGHDSFRRELNSISTKQSTVSRTERWIQKWEKDNLHRRVFVSQPYSVDEPSTGGYFIYYHAYFSLLQWFVSLFPWNMFKNVTSPKGVKFEINST